MLGGSERRVGGAGQATSKRRAEDAAPMRRRWTPERPGVLTNDGGRGRRHPAEIQPGRTHGQGYALSGPSRAATHPPQRKLGDEAPAPMCRPFIIPSRLVMTGILPVAIHYFFEAYIGERVFICAPSGSVYSVLVESRDYGPVLGSGWIKTLYVENYQEHVKVLLEPAGDRRFRMRFFDEGIELPCVDPPVGPDLIIEFESDETDTDYSSSDDTEEGGRSSSDEEIHVDENRFILARNTKPTDDLVRRMEEVWEASSKEAKLYASRILPSHLSHSQFFFNTKFSRTIPRSCAEAILKMEGTAGSSKVTLMRSTDKICRITTGWNAFCSDHKLKIGDVFVFSLSSVGSGWEIVLHRV
ncbi:hypothetical protein EJB05_44433, partial [Eragrostis curvula]